MVRTRGAMWGETGFFWLLRGHCGTGECCLLSGPPSYPVVSGAVVGRLWVVTAARARDRQIGVPSILDGFLGFFGALDDQQLLVIEGGGGAGVAGSFTSSPPSM